MGKNIKRLVALNILCIFLSSCTLQTSSMSADYKNPVIPEKQCEIETDSGIYLLKHRVIPPRTDDEFKLLIKRKYEGMIPTEWGESTHGVKRLIDTDKKIIALTFDACGGKNGDGYDKKLIDYLVSEKIPATLFINSLWIDLNYDTFMELSKNPIFEIENHGSRHTPLSTNGKSIYGINGADSLDEVIDEVLINEHKIVELTGRKPKFFRSGTAYYDEIAVSIVEEIGEKAVNFNVIGDAGATFSKEQVKNACMSAAPGSIIIMHMNHPLKDTAEGMMLAVPILKANGFEFVKLEDYDAYLK